MLLDVHHSFHRDGSLVKPRRQRNSLAHFADFLHLSSLV